MLSRSYAYSSSSHGRGKLRSDSSPESAKLSLNTIEAASLAEMYRAIRVANELEAAVQWFVYALKLTT